MPTPAAFAALGGIPRRGIYDNMKTAVDKVKKGKGRIVNARFCRHGLALPVRPGLLQCRQRLGERRRREERAGQPAAASGRMPARSASAPSPNSTSGCSNAAGRCGRNCAIPSTPSSRVAEMLEHEQPQPDADGGAVRWLCRNAGQGVQHLPGDAGSQPLLGAVRTGGANGQHAAVSGAHRHRGARCRGGQSSPQLQPTANALRLAALHSADRDASPAP